MRFSADEKLQMSISGIVFFLESGIFVANNHKLKLFVIMVTLQYYDEIEKAVKAPSAITDFFNSSDDDSNEEKLFFRLCWM